MYRCCSFSSLCHAPTRVNMQADFACRWVPLHCISSRNYKKLIFALAKRNLKSDLIAFQPQPCNSSMEGVMIGSNVIHVHVLTCLQHTLTKQIPFKQYRNSHQALDNLHAFICWYLVASDICLGHSHCTLPSNIALFAIFKNKRAATFRSGDSLIH